MGGRENESIHGETKTPESVNSVHPSPSCPVASGSSPHYSDYKNWFPWLVPVFVVANVIIFGVTMYVNNCPKNSEKCIVGFLGRFSFQTLKENPFLGPSSDTLVKMGALEAFMVVSRHQVWRLITCMWLHAGVFHVLANMLSLVVIGIRLEQEFGFARIGFLYFISGFGGSLMSALFLRENISVGASGALFGLLGAMLSELITNWSMYAHKIAALLTLISIAVLNLAVGILPHMDNYAHIGGFVSGYFLGFVFFVRPQFGWVRQGNTLPSYVATSVKSKYKTYQIVLWFISLILLITGFTVGLIMLLHGFNANGHCSWCHYLTCVPTSIWNCNSKNVYCQSVAIGNQLKLTCLGSGRSRVYNLSEGTSQIQQYCSQLCR